METSEQPVSQEVKGEIKDLTGKFRETLRSSPEFTRKALNNVILQGRMIEIPQEKVVTAPEERVGIRTEDLEDAAIDHFFQGKSPEVHLSFRLGFDDFGVPYNREQGKYQEIVVNFPNADTINLEYRERDIKDTAWESPQAPAWTRLNLNGHRNDPHVVYKSGLEGSTVTADNSRVTIEKGRDLLDKIKKGIILPRF